MRLSDVRLAAALGALALVVSACSSGSDAPVATTITVTPGTLTFNSINQTSAALVAKVFDQRGDSMPGVAVTWSTSNATVATVNTTTGAVTSHANGTATVTATTGSATHDVAVTVAQVATGLSKSGDTQTGTVGAALATPIAVHFTDALGNVIAGANVTFAVTAGGGNVSSGTVATSASGDAQTTWTLGTAAGTAQTMTAALGTAVATFTATAQAGAASAVVIQAGNNQTRVVNGTVATAPSVRVNDSFGNAKSGITVVFAVTGGGGSVTGATKVTTAGGIATVGSWTMGAAAGPNTLSATIQGTATSVAFTATATAAGAAANIAVSLGDAQTALVGYPTNVRPAVLVTDAGGQPSVGVSVTFAAVTGGGSVTNATVLTNSSGIAQVGAWTVGVAAGANTMTATAAGGGITGNPATFTATAAVRNYQITIQNVGPAFSVPVQAAFDSAVAFWRRSIYASVGTSTVNSAAGQCGTGSPAINQAVTDLLILARIDTIDGPGAILGSAGPCFVHGTSKLTVMGAMRFDSADMATLVGNGSLNAVIRHEMGHVIGIGTLWNQPTLGFNCLLNSSATGNVKDTSYPCARGSAAFDSIGGVNYTGGAKVPVENCSPASPAGCGSGTVNSHWREPTFFNEMMTGYLNSGVANPASLLTVASLEDIGYVVNYGAAETYTRVFTAPPALLAASGQIVDLRDDVYTGPLYIAGPGGRAILVPRQ